MDHQFILQYYTYLPYPLVDKELRPSSLGLQRHRRNKVSGVKG